VIQNYFLLMIKQLREQEEVMLYNNLLQISEDSANEVLTFLKKEYENESLNYPYQAPNFHPEAGLWAAKTLYFSAQLLLYREHKDTDLDSLIPNYDKTIGASEILSADICLRFIPLLIQQLKFIDSEDKLITILEQKLATWHYSGVQYPLEMETLDFTVVSEHLSLLQLYTNRIIQYKKIKLAKLPLFKTWIEANMGIYSQTFWADYKLETITINDEH
jgi:hypothetical protein